jgi:3-hydroxyisobutyrate dehydrogenase-like beta-hydroxyacid dehydrogenase
VDEIGRNARDQARGRPLDRQALRLAGLISLSGEVRLAGMNALKAVRRLRARSVEADDYPPRFALYLARKDAELAAEAGLDLRLTEAARAWLAEAEEAGWGERDYSAVLAWILRRAPS